MTDTGLALRHISRLHERWNSCIAGRNCVFGLVPSPGRGIFSDWPSALPALKSHPAPYNGARQNLPDDKFWRESCLFPRLNEY
jgi:hypothetical protein